jgi:hypothetical protein
VGPRAGLDGCGKSRPHRDSIPGPSRYPGPHPVIEEALIPEALANAGRPQTTRRPTNENAIIAAVAREIWSSSRDNMGEGA